MKMRFPEYAKENNQKGRLFKVGFFNLPAVNKLRELKTNNLGRLMSVYGTVTRTTEVKPELQHGSFKCLECNSLVNGVE